MDLHLLIKWHMFYWPDTTQDLWDSNWDQVFKNSWIPTSQGRHQKNHQYIFYMCLHILNIKMEEPSTKCSIWSWHCISNISRQKEIFFLLRLFFQYEGRGDQTVHSSSPASMRSIKLQQGYPAPSPKVSAHARVDRSLLVKQKWNKHKKTWWRVSRNYKISQAHNTLYRANY